MEKKNNNKLMKVYINLFDWGVANNIYKTLKDADKDAEGRNRILVITSFIPQLKWFEYCNNKNINPKHFNKINNADVDISKKYLISNDDMWKIYHCWHGEFTVAIDDLKKEIRAEEIDKCISSLSKTFIKDLTTIKKWINYKKPSMSQEEYITRKILSYELRLKHTDKILKKSKDDLKKEIRNELLEELSNDMLKLKRDKCYQSVFDILEKKQKENKK